MRCGSSSARTRLGRGTTDAPGFGIRGARDLTGARFQPWLFSVAALSVVPVLMANRGSVFEFVLVALAVTIGFLAWIAERTGRLGRDGRRHTASILAFSALVALAFVLRIDGGQQPEAYLLLASSLAVTLAALPDRWVRVSLQAGVLAVMAMALGASGRPTADVLFAVVLLVAPASLAGAFVHRMRVARGVALRAEAEARDRAELLDVVRALPGTSVIEAGEVVCRTLRSLGFDGAAVLRLRGDELVSVAASGSRGAMSSRRPGDGVSWSAIDEDRTVVRQPEPRDRREPRHRRVPGRATSATAGGDRSDAWPGTDVAVPVRADGRAVAVLVGAWDSARVPTEEELEIVEVLASHLGGVLAAQQRLARQGELLERMGALDRMRRGLIGAVSDEVRDPLTIIRGAGQILATHAERVGVEQRFSLLDRMCTQAADLSELVDLLLDFSRSSSPGEDTTVGPTSLVQLLDQVSGESGVGILPPMAEISTWDPMVEVDASLFRSALTLLLTLRPAPGEPDVAIITVMQAPGVLALGLRSVRPSPASQLVLSVASGLLEAGGAALDVGESLTIRLPRAGAPAATVSEGPLPVVPDRRP